ncbi:MAG: D-Ala-D-Ala carboxypeptidase family metallohydrolase [Candidatus Humimicrobiaceae bacterium]
MKPNYIPDNDWQLVNSICNFNPEEPYLIASIGWHETHWGTIGAGVNGYHLGFGFYPGSPLLAKVKGLENQLKYAHKFIMAHFIFPVTLESTTEFAVNHWKSSVPTAWAKSVYSQFINITKEQSVDQQLTTNFKYSEFWDHNIEPPKEYYPNILALAIELQKVRDIVNRPITITSGWRTVEHNASFSNSSSNSQHLIGKAADVRIKGLEPKFANIYLAKYGNFNGFGIALNYTHVDIRDSFGIWDY